MAKHEQTRAEIVEREDVVMFINACFACTGQREFYSTDGGHTMGIEFLHRYILGNYRRVYARTLATGINHFNQTEVVFNLLSAGAPPEGEERRVEGELLFMALRRLPPQRVFRLFGRLKRFRINNRRSRALIRRYLGARKDPFFDAVKYRHKVRDAVRHAHLPLGDERARYLFGELEGVAFDQPLLEKCRQAHYAQSAVYELPFTVAEGFAERHGIARARFLERIAPRMTTQEKLRLHQAAGKARAGLELDIGRSSLTRLASYIVSLPLAERERRRDSLTEALDRAAARVAASGPQLGHVVAVLDHSYSATGTTEKGRRPLALALAIHRVLARVSARYTAFWTTPCDDDLLMTAVGQTDLARPLLRGLAKRPDLVVIVSDGFENAPAAGAAQVARVYRESFDPHHRLPIVHLNPAFDGADLAPRGLGDAIATVGIRDAESLFTMLAFARFALAATSLTDLEHYLQARADHLLRDRAATP